MLFFCVTNILLRKINDINDSEEMKKKAGLLGQ